jgi:5,10-methylenetetrahydromethanopterin reductase
MAEAKGAAPVDGKPIVRRKTKLGIALWGTQPMPRLIEQVRLAEQLGLESVWVIDSQLICRDIFVTLAACLASTSRILLATGVTNPRTRHVSATASAIATLEEMFPGRVLAGVGTGFSSLRTVGMAAARATQLERFVLDLKALLRNDSVEFENGVRGGITWLEHACAVPVVVAASGPKITRMAAGIADGAILLQGIAPDLLARGIGWLKDGAQNAGRDFDELAVTCWTPLGLGATSAAGRGDVRARVASAIMQTNPDWFEGEERDTVRQLKASYQDYKHASSRPDHAALVSDRMVERYAIAGDAVEVSERLAELLTHPCLDRIVLTPHGGASSLDEVLRVLGNDVLPKLGDAAPQSSAARSTKPPSAKRLGADYP